MEDFSKDSRFKKIHTRINGSGEIEGLFKHDTIVKTIVASRCIYGIELNAYLGAKALRFATPQRRPFKFFHSPFKSFFQNDDPWILVQVLILYRSRDIFF